MAETEIKVAEQGQKAEDRNISISDIINITWFNIHYIKPSDLENEEVFKKFVKFVKDIDAYTEGYRAKECFDILWKLLDANSEIAKENPDLLRRYFELLVILRSNFINFLDDREIEVFFQNFVLLALTVSTFSIPDFNFREKIRLFFKWDLWYFDEEAREQMRGFATKALESNEEYLGSEPLVIKEGGQRVEQTVRYWLEDYNRYTVSKRGVRGPIERFEYTQKSGNVKTLDADQRMLLLKLLEFYDWLKYSGFDDSFETEPTVQVAPALTPEELPEDLKLTGLTRVRPGTALPESEFPKPKIEPLPATPSAMQGRPKFATQNLSGPAPMPKPISSPPKIDDFARPKTVAPPLPPVEKKLPTPPPPRPQSSQNLSGPAAKTAPESLERKMDMQSGLTHVEDFPMKQMPPPPPRPPALPSQGGPKFVPQNLGGQANLPTSKIDVKPAGTFSMQPKAAPPKPAGSPSLAELEKMRQKFEGETREPLNQRTYEPKNLRTQEPKNQRTYEPENMRTGERENKEHRFSLNEAIIRGKIQKEEREDDQESSN